MKFLVAYTSTTGHSLSIARHAMDRLFDHGHSVELLCPLDVDDLQSNRFDGAVLTASIHANQYQRTFVQFVEKNVSTLNSMPTLFLSVSLTAAGHDAEDWAGLRKIDERFLEATGWTPGQLEHVAGAYLPSQYDVVTRFIMRRIVSAKDPEIDPGADHDYTDWDKLTQTLLEWTATVQKATES